MFWHNFKYSLLALFKNKALIFWTFAFPIILGTFFNLAFSDIENSEMLHVFDIAIVETDEDNEIFKTAIDALSEEGSDDQLFNTKYTTLSDAKELLETGDIVGYIVLTDTPKVVIKSNGINETILKTVTEEIVNSTEILKTIVEENMGNISIPFEYYETYYNRIIEEARELMNESEANIVDISNVHMSYTMIEFYTLIAMACLYGGILGLSALNNMLANMSNRGKRVAVSPSSKWKLILSSVLASYITQLVGIFLLFVYTIFVLHVDYGDNLPLIVVLTLAGCLAGLSIGIGVSSLIKSNENLKTGIIISFTMFGCFLSGMMGITMKYIVDKNIPILNKINPANMITDGFYSLYYYDTLDRFSFNLISLLVFAGILIGISVFFLRRQKYDSI